MRKAVTDRFHEAAAGVWKECLNHPFVTGIGDGTLPAEKFQFFMLQDYLYLFDYARVFALGVVKARTPELMRTFAKNVDAILDGEMKIHRTYMERLGITEEQVFAVKPALDNLSYTNYMLSVAQAGGVMEIVASILACSWSYAEIGCDPCADSCGIPRPRCSTVVFRDLCGHALCCRYSIYIFNRILSGCIAKYKCTDDKNKNNHCQQTGDFLPKTLPYFLFKTDQL